MPYLIILFEKLGNHRKGATNIDIKRLARPFPNLLEAEQRLYEYMSKHRTPGVFLRIDKNVRHNPIAFADLNIDGGIIRFKSRDNIHWSKSISLSKFYQRILRELAHKNHRKARSTTSTTTK